MERALVCPAPRRIAHLALILGLATAPLACGGDDDGDGGDDGGTGPIPTTPPAQVAINITGFAFSPRVDTVAVGGTVTWTNNDQAPHTSTSSASPPLWDSGNLTNGQSFARAFPTAGSYPYVCSLHSGMSGTIVAR